MQDCEGSGLLVICIPPSDSLTILASFPGLVFSLPIIFVFTLLTNSNDINPIIFLAIIFSILFYFLLGKIITRAIANNKV